MGQSLPPHRNPNGKRCNKGNFFPTNEKWHWHPGGMDKCPYCKADVSIKGGIPKSSGGGGFEVSIPWPENSPSRPLWLSEVLEGRTLVLKFETVLSEILKIMEEDDDNNRGQYPYVELVCNSNYEINWAYYNIEKLNEEIHKITGTGDFVNIANAPEWFGGDWIIQPD
jgi:hypothetical protein